MARAYQVAVSGTSVTQPTLVADMVTMAGGGNVTIRNNATTTSAYIGGDENTVGGSTTLTAATGYILPPQAAVTVEIRSSEKIYGRSDHATVSVTLAVFRTNRPAGG